MKLKQMIGTAALCTLMLVTTGCMRMYETISIHDSNTATVTLKTCMSKEYMDSISNSSTTTTTNGTLETLEDGKEYYCSQETADGSLKDLKTENGGTFSPDIFFLPLSTAGSSTGDTAAASQSLSGSDQASEIASAIANGIYVQMTIQLPGDIVDTNGSLTDSHTAVFATDQPITDRWYAYTEAGKQRIEADHSAPSIHGISQDKYYKAIPDITFTDDTGVMRIEVNGTAARRSDATSTAAVNGKLEKNTTYNWVGIVNGAYADLCKSGKNTFTVYDINGNSSAINFYLDSKAPSIKGVKKGKTYKKKAVLYVKDSGKLAKVTIDGKAQKLTGSKLVKKGSYKNFYKFKLTKAGKHKVTACDAAGNKQTISFKIAK